MSILILLVDICTNYSEQANNCCSDNCLHLPNKLHLKSVKLQRLAGATIVTNFLVCNYALSQLFNIVIFK